MNSNSCSAFLGYEKIASGSVLEVALEVKKELKKNASCSILVFDNMTGRTIDLDLRGGLREISERYRADNSDSKNDEPKSGPGRPKLGVVAREVTLLPRHWEWLATQPGGASVTLRKLVEAAKNKNQKKDEIRLAGEAAHRFMTAMAGDLPGYEEALRAFYAKKFDVFKTLIGAWPKDLRNHVLKLSAPVIELEKN